MENQNSYQKAAAIFLGIVGLVISVTSKNILGATIGNANNNFSNFIGIVLVFNFYALVLKSF